MPIQNYGVISLPMVGGVDTRTEPRSIQAPKLTTLLNGRFGKPGTIRKRQGYVKTAELAMNDAASGAFFDQAITDARKLVTLGSSTWLLGAENVYALNADRQRWKLAAQAPVVGLTYGPTRGYNDSLSQVDMGERVTLPNGIVVVMLRVLAVGLQVTFYDATGAILAEKFIAGGGAFFPKMVAVGNAVLVLYGQTPNVIATAFDTAPLTTGNPLLATTRNSVTDLNANNVYDVAVSGGRILLAYNTTVANTLKVGYLLADGQADGAFTTQATAAAPTALACAAETTAHTVVLAWQMASIPRVDARMYTEALAALFAVVASGVPAAAGGFVAAVFRNPTTAEVFLDTAGVPAWQSKVQRSVITTAGAATISTAWLLHATIVGKPWLMNGRVYLPVVNAGDGPQFTLFIVASATATDPTIIGAAYPGLLTGTLSGTAGLSRPDVRGSRASVLPIQQQTSSLQVAGEITLDHAFVPQSVETGGEAYWTGAALWMLDGRNVVESGFWLYPNNIVLSQGAAGGQTLLATYSYQVFYEWFSDKKQRWISSFAGAQSITLTGANGTVTVTVPTLTMTNKPGVRISVYRTQANGSVFNRIGLPAANDRTVQSVAIADGNADSVIVSNELAYVTGGVFDNIAPLACSCAAVGNERIFISGLQDPDLVWASQLQDFGTALNFNDALTIALPPAGGAPVTALSELRDSLIVFRQRQIYIVGGDGPNNSGTLGQFEPPRTISEDVGAISPSSVVKLPMGIMFQSLKGIYMLGLDLTLSYVGADVEAFNGDTVTAAIALADSHEVRFTLASGKTLVFDYLQATWSVWTIGGLCAALSAGRYFILPSSSGRLLQETAGVFSDDGTPYSLVIETPWMHLAGVQGLQRVRRALFLGDYHGGHHPLVSYAYNYEPFYGDRQTWDPGTVIGAQLLGGNGGLLGSGKTFGGNDASGRVATSVYQFRSYPARPKCMALKIRIEDLPSPGVALGEGYSLSEIALEVALRPGAFNPGSDRVTS